MKTPLYVLGDLVIIKNEINEENVEKQRKYHCFVYALKRATHFQAKILASHCAGKKWFYDVEQNHESGNCYQGKIGCVPESDITSRLESSAED